MRNIISDGTYIYITLREGGSSYQLQRRLISDGTLGAGCWSVDLTPYYFIYGAGVSSICIDGSFIYCLNGGGIIVKFDITDGSHVWDQTYSADQVYKVRQYGSYIYTCGLSTSSWKPVINQIDKSDGSIYYTFEGSPDFAPVTAMDIDSTGFYVCLYDTSEVPVKVIFNHLDFSWSVIWSTPVNAPPPPGTDTDIRVATLKVDSAEVVAVGYEYEYIDPNDFFRGRRDTINKTTGVVTDTKFWPDTDNWYCKMTGVDKQGSDIFTGGYKTVPIGDPNYNHNNTRWIMTRGNPTIT